MTIDPVEDIFQDLFLRYEASTRVYHNIDHVADCLRVLDELSQEYGVANKDQIEAAIWFHDIIYETESSSAVADSIKYANIQLSRLFIRNSYLKGICSLIKATDHTQDLCLNTSEDTIRDIDLWILGSEPHVYDNYEWGISCEYNKICSKDEYIAGRRGFLKSMLSKAFIYNNLYFIQNYDKQAEANMKYELETIEDYIRKH